MPRNVFSLDESSGVLSVVTEGTDDVGVAAPDFSRDAGLEATGVVPDDEAALRVDIVVSPSDEDGK